MENRIFKFSLILSLLIHSALLVQLSYSNMRSLKRPLKNIEIAYYILDPAKYKDSARQEQKGAVDKELKNKTEVFLDKDVHKSPFMKDMSKLSDEFNGHKKQPAQVTRKQKKRKIVVPPLRSEEIAIPEYQLYYHDIRNWIKERALANIDFSRLDVGDVYLTFVISSEGLLEKIQILDERTKASQYLKEISLKSVKEASEHFKPFPKDLKYPELPFNVVISFKMED